MEGTVISFFERVAVGFELKLDLKMAYRTFHLTSALRLRRSAFPFL